MGCGDKCAGCALETIGHGFTEVEIGARYQSGKLLIVGEASGEAESRESLPFRPHAQSGSLLSDALRTVGVGRGDVAITNVIRCRPPKDWLEGAPYQHNAIYNCTLRYLEGVIRELQPAAILALGGTAQRALTAPPKGKYGALDYARGYVGLGAGVATGIPVVSTYHPAFVRRGMAHLTPLLHRDLRRAWLVAQGKLVRGTHWGTPTEFGLRYQTAPSIDEAWRYFKTLDESLPLSADLETPKSTREDEEERVESFADRDILMCQFTQRRCEGIALPWRDDFIDVAHSILRAKTGPKFGHNWWNFDQEVLRANDIELPDEFDDTMVMHHFYWSDLPANLQAAAQMNGFQWPWKHYNETDKEFYGVADVDAAMCVYQGTRALLEREGMWESYRRYFAQVQPILRDMSRRGIPIDNERREELKALIAREDVRVSGAIREMVPRELLGWEPKGGLKRPPALECKRCGGKFRGEHECVL